MPIRLETPAVEGQAYPIRLTFTDSAGAAVVPTSLRWSLYDDQGAIVNGRELVEVTGLAAAVTVVLADADLWLAGGGAPRGRRLYVRARYSSTEGSNLPLEDEVTFTITPLVGRSGGA